MNGVVKALAVDDALRLLSGPGFVSAGGDLAANAPIDVALPGGGAVRVVQGGNRDKRESCAQVADETGRSSII